MLRVRCFVFPAHSRKVRETIMFNPDTGVPLSKEAEDLISRSWKNNGDVASANDFRVTYSDLEKATDGFSDAMRIGGGGSCTVFRGRLFTTEVAIKVLKQAQDEHVGTTDMPASILNLEVKQFFAEMQFLQAVHHPNICRLLAVSVDGPHRW